MSGSDVTMGNAGTLSLTLLRPSDDERISRPQDVFARDACVAFIVKFVSSTSNTCLRSGGACAAVDALGCGRMGFSGGGARWVYAKLEPRLRRGESGGRPTDPAAVAGGTGGGCTSAAVVVSMLLGVCTTAGSRLRGVSAPESSSDGEMRGVDARSFDAATAFLANGESLSNLDDAGHLVFGISSLGYETDDSQSGPRSTDVGDFLWNGMC